MTLNNIEISVIVPTFRHEQFIESCLNSIIQQKLNFNIEILVGDDCSPDGTASVIERIAKSDDRIVLYKWLRNEGGLKNIDKLLEKARGRYISIIEGDDFWLTNDHLYKSINYLNNDNSLSFVATNYLNFHNDSYFMRQKMSVMKTTRLKFWQLAFGNFLQMGTMVFRRELFARIPNDAFDFHIGDYPMILLLLNQGDGLLLESFNMAYREHSGGVWSVQSNNNKINQTQETIRWMIDRKYFIYFKKIFLRIYLAKLKFSAGNKLVFIEFFLYLPVFLIFILFRNFSLPTICDNNRELKRLNINA